MRVRKPLFIIESKYDRADREKKEMIANRNTILLILTLAGGIIAFSQCGSRTDGHNHHSESTHSAELE